MSERSADWRRTPRKRVLTPGRPMVNGYCKLSPAERKKREAAQRDRERLRHQRRRLAKKAIVLFETAFAVAVVHGLERAAIEAARPAPVAVDRET